MTFEQNANNIKSQEKQGRKVWLRIVSVLSAITVFCTTYALILPAITMVDDDAVVCGMVNHKHTDECYEIRYTAAFSCLDGIHKHTSECYNNGGVCVCGYADYVIHEHDDNCYDKNGNLICTLPEVKAYRQGLIGSLISRFLGKGSVNAPEYHAHTEECYDESGKLACGIDEVTVAIAHTHSSSCYNSQGKLVCGQNEVRAHQHTDCVSVAESKTLVCGLPEHEHDMGCFKQADPENPYYCGCDYEHVHTDECYEDGKLHCTYIEHTHTSLCLIPPETPAEKTVSLSSGMSLAFSTTQSSLPFPSEEITLKANEVHDEEVENFLESVLTYRGIEVSDVVLMDISLDHFGEEVEPVGPVTVTFSVNGLIDVDAVYHIDMENNVVTNMNAVYDPETDTVTMETTHFSTFALAAGGDKKSPSAVVNAVFSTSSYKFTSVTIDAQCGEKDMYFRVESYDGATWSACTDWSAKTGQNTVVSFDITSDTDTMTLDTRYRVRAAKNTGDLSKDTGVSATFGVFDMLNSEAPGFAAWYDNEYRVCLGGGEPKNIRQLLNVYALYISLSVSSSIDEEGNMIVTASTSYIGIPTFEWQYYDIAASSWKTLDGADGNVLNVSDYASDLAGGKQMRVLLYDEIGDLHTVKSVGWVNPNRAEYDEIINKINVGLGLGGAQTFANKTTPAEGEPNYPISVGGVKTEAKDGALTMTNNFITIYPDISIGGEKFNTCFFWDEVAADPRVPFTGPEDYADYIAGVYADKLAETGSEEKALAAAKEKWEYYLFDIYDPSHDGGYSANYSKYPGAGTYGDKTVEFRKDDGSSSFHSTNPIESMITEENPMIEPLEYNYLDSGIDYTNFVSNLSKTAAAVDAGDKNTERKYLIDIDADAQAKATAPVAMILQIQTSWQMFDDRHATYNVGDGGSQVGGVAKNSELASLYDIKHALLRFIDIMETTYPGNTLVLGVTETQHSGSQTMFLHPDGGSAGNYVYVSNNTELLRESIVNWDIFGNCEHVHYDSNQLQLAIQHLPDNLSGWKDKAGNPISYEDIQKVAVIIGGPTEFKSDKDGYGCTLPWVKNNGNDKNKVSLAFNDTLTVKDEYGEEYQIPVLNSVYGIRTNSGTPVEGAPVISWIDYSGNNSGPEFHDGQAVDGVSSSRFTKKYVATNEDAILAALMNIAETEILKNGIDLEAEDAYVEDVVLYDTVADEFVIDESVPFTATVYNSEKYASSSEKGQKFYETVVDPVTGDVTFTTFADGKAVSTANIKGELVAFKDASGLKTTTVTFTANQPYKTKEKVAGKDEYITVTKTKPVEQKLVIQEKADGTTDVAYTYGEVYNTKKCKLHFGIVAKEDYLGSNNVYTNETTPEMYFTHYEDKDGSLVAETHRRTSGDTPMVNVPVRYTTEDGGIKKVIQYTKVDLGMDLTLNSHVITDDIQRLATLYDQINGTLTYTWIFPDDTEDYECGTVHISNGKIVEGAFPSRVYDYEAKKLGLQTLTLMVSFVPDDADQESENFKKDGVTPVPVERKDPTGHVWVHSFATDSVTDVAVRKDWKDAPPDDLENLKFVLKCRTVSYDDGEYDEDAEYDTYVYTGTDGKWAFTDDFDKAQRFLIEKSNDWKASVQNLPAIKSLGDDEYLFYEYQPEEIDLPSRYKATYGVDMQVKEIPEYTVKLSVTFTASSEIKAEQPIAINYSYGGADDNIIYGKNEHEKFAAGQTYTIDINLKSTVPLELDPETQQPYELIIDSFLVQKEQKGGKPGEQPAEPEWLDNVVSGVKGKAERVLTGMTAVASPVSVITNELMMTDVTVSKKVVGNALSNKFPFNVQALKGEILDPTDGDNYTLNADGTATFDLAHGGSVTLRVLPGSEIVICETNHDGCYVTIKQDGAADSINDTAVLDVGEDNLAIEFVNTVGHPLPSTGGTGREKLYALSGAIMTTSAYGCGLMYFKRKKEDKADEKSDKKSDDKPE